MQATKTHAYVRNLVLSALFLALGIVLPFVTGQIPQIGSMLLPMHLPVLICGLICGWQYGAAIGFILPPLRYVLFGMPPIFPTGVSMAFEMAAYGLLVGLLYAHSRRKNLFTLYRSLVIAMLGGRVVWGVVRVLCSGAAGSAFTWQLFMAGAFLNAIPGIILQLVLIPVLMVALDRLGVMRFDKKETA